MQPQKSHLTIYRKKIKLFRNKIDFNLIVKKYSILNLSVKFFLTRHILLKQNHI